MKKLSLALAAASVLIAAPAVAADLGRAPARAPAAYAPAPQYAMWNGFYIGVNVGYGAGVEDTGVLVPGGTTVDLGPALAAGVIPVNFGVKRDGITGGGQIGYNFQAGAFVAGIEADIQGSGIGGDVTIQTNVPGFVPATSFASTDLTWFGTVRGRVGVGFDRALLYATGGFAYGGVEDSVTLRSTAAPFNPNFNGAIDQTRTGYTVGGGFEYLFSPNWSLKAEYLFVDLGSTTVTAFDPVNNPLSQATYEFDHRYHIGRIGVNYKFGGPGPVMASY